MAILDPIWRAIPQSLTDTEKRRTDADAWAAKQRAALADEWAAGQRADLERMMASYGGETGLPPIAGDTGTAAPPTEVLGAMPTEMRGYGPRPTPRPPLPALPTLPGSGEPAGAMADPALGGTPAAGPSPLAGAGAVGQAGLDVLAAPGRIVRGGLTTEAGDMRAPGERLRQGFETARMLNPDDTDTANWNRALQMQDERFDRSFDKVAEIDPTGGVAVGALRTGARLATDPTFLAAPGVGKPWPDA